MDSTNKMSQTDIDRIIGQVTKKLLMVLLPTIIITVGGMLLRDHFALANKADYDDLYQLQLLIESKNRAFEDLAQKNEVNIEHLQKQDDIQQERMDRIDDYQHQIDQLIRKEFGSNRGIPELSNN